MINTRLEKNWGLIKSDIINQWDMLTEDELGEVNGSFDKLVELIRQRATPKRARLSIEADIRDSVLAKIAHYEKQEEL